jgi:hypothetical protein
MTSAAASTDTDTDTGTGSTSCAFPGCDRPVRARAGDGGGKPPIYCDLLNPTTGTLTHTPLTAARERDRRQRQGTNGQPPTLIGQAPASAARERAASLLAQFRVPGEQITATLAARSRRWAPPVTRRPSRPS